MILFHSFYLTVRDYAERGRGNDCPDYECCPQCKARTRLYRHGWYYRTVIEGDDCLRIPIRRLRCPDCRKSFSVLPDFLLPYYQVPLYRILLIINNRFAQGITPSPRQRTQFYVRRFSRQLMPVALALRSSGFLEELPTEKTKRAIKLLDTIAALGEATFVRRFRDLFQQTFMAPLHIHSTALRAG